MARFDLRSECHRFTEDIQELLNKTVADDARVNSVISGGRGLVGTNLDGHLNSSAVRLRSSSHRHHVWLRVAFTLIETNGYLTVTNSTFGVSASQDHTNPMFHYDYERDKRENDGYTEAHVQVFGSNADLEPLMVALCTYRKKKSMSELHFPVGGKRFRPALEDVIEFLLDEGLAEGKDKAVEVLNDHRQRFRTIQLRAAIRQEQDTAVDALRKLGYTITSPVTAASPRVRPGKRRSSR